MLEAMKASLQPIVDKLLASNNGFAKDYEKSNKTIDDFISLLYKNAYDAVVRNGRHNSVVGGFPTDEEVETILINYFHETAEGRDVENLGFNLSVEKIDKKSATPAVPVIPTVPSEPEPVETDAEEVEDDSDDVPTPVVPLVPSIPTVPSEPEPVETDDDDDDCFDPFA